MKNVGDPPPPKKKKNISNFATDNVHSDVSSPTNLKLK